MFRSLWRYQWQMEAIMWAHLFNSHQQLEYDSLKLLFVARFYVNVFFFVFVSSAESALTGELKISRMSTVVGSAAGNDDLFMFVEKVGKSKKKIHFSIRINLIGEWKCFFFNFLKKKIRKYQSAFLWTRQRWSIDMGRLGEIYRSWCSSSVCNCSKNAAISKDEHWRERKFELNVTLLFAAI